MLRRIAAFAGFYGPIIELTKHVLVSIEVPFPAEYQEALDRAEQVAQPHKHSRGVIYPPVISTAEPFPCIEYELGVKAFKSALVLYISHQFQSRHRHPFKMARCSINYAHLRREHGRTAKWEAVNPGYQYKRVNNSYFRDSYKQRAFATIPGLALLLERKNTEEDLGLTWQYYYKQGYHQQSNDTDTFHKHLPMSAASCPKLEDVKRIVHGLGDIQWRLYDEADGTFVETTVPDKRPVSCFSRPNPRPC